MEGCAAWLICELIPEPHNQQEHDLFIGKVIAAYADDRVFRNGHWYYHEVDAEGKVCIMLQVGIITPLVTLSMPTSFNPNFYCNQSSSIKGIQLDSVLSFLPIDGLFLN